MRKAGKSRIDSTWWSTIRCSEAEQQILPSNQGAVSQNQALCRKLSYHEPCDLCSTVDAAKLLHTGGSQVFNKKQKCSMGAQCPFAHSEEAWLCKNFIRLPRNFLKKMTRKGFSFAKLRNSSCQVLILGLAYVYP